MALPRSFQFSATSLQDYADCARRFQLRYLLQVAWPAPDAEPIEAQEYHAQLARDFHRLAHQHLLGLPADTLAGSIQEPELKRWWRAYLAYIHTFGDKQIIPEVGLSMPLAGHRLVAQFDAIVIGSDCFKNQKEPQAIASEDKPSLLIVDWKTYRQRPSRDWLGRRLQTRVYPPVLIEAGVTKLDPLRNTGETTIKAI
jgi:hypothetical protein